MNQNAEHTERTEPSLPVPTKHTERSAIAWIVRPRDAAERRGAVVLWWVLALLFCGPQHFLALPYFPLGLALVPSFVVWLFPVASPGEDGLVVLFVLAWIVYALLTTTLLVFSGRGGRRWRVLAWTLVVLLLINTIGCDLIWNGGIE